MGRGSDKQGDRDDSAFYLWVIIWLVLGTFVKNGWAWFALFLLGPLVLMLLEAWQRRRDERTRY